MQRHVMRWICDFKDCARTTDVVQPDGGPPMGWIRAGYVKGDAVRCDFCSDSHKQQWEADHWTPLYPPGKQA